MIKPRPEVGAAPPAVHGGPLGSRDELDPVQIDFSASLNAWGPAAEVVAAVRAAPISDYPDPESLAVRRAAAALWDRPLEEIAFGAGAAELLHAVAFAFLRPGDRALVPTPTFGEYARAAALCGAEPVSLWASAPEWKLEPEALVREVVRQRPRLLFLCLPNNPTGQALLREEVAVLADTCAEHGTLLVLDQSYDAFLAEPLGTPPLPGHPSVVAVRSITKDHALAGIRAGFVVAPPEVAAALESARVPWAASSPAQAAALAALSPAGEAHLRRTIPRLRAERERLEEELAGLGLPTVPSVTHLLLVEVGDAAGVTHRLRQQHGLGVRDCTSFGLPRHVRIAARTPPENDRLLEGLEVVCSS